MPRSPSSPSLLYSGMKDSSEESDDSSSAGWSDKVDSSSSSSSSSSSASSTSSHSEEEDPLPPAKPSPTTTPKGSPQGKSASPSPGKANSAAQKGGDSKGTTNKKAAASKAAKKAGDDAPKDKAAAAKATPPRSTASPKSTPEVRGASPVLEKPSTPDAAARSLTPPRSPTRTLSPPLPPASSSMNSLVSGRLNEALGESGAAGTDAAPTMPAKRVSRNDMMYGDKGDDDDDDDDDDDSSGSGSNDSFKSSKTRPESGEKLEAVGAEEEEAPKEDPPKRRSFFGRFGGSKRDAAGGSGTNPSQPEDGSMTKDGAEVPQSEEAPDSKQQQEKSPRKGFGLFRSGRKPSGDVDSPNDEGTPTEGGILDADIPAEDVLAAQNEEVNFEAAPEEAAEATKKRGWMSRKARGGEPAGDDQPDLPQDGDPAAPPKRASWFGRRNTQRAASGDTQEMNSDVEAGKVFSPSNTEATAREYGNGADDPRKKRRNIICMILAVIILAGAACGAAYGGVTLANRTNGQQPTGGAEPVPVSASPCENDDVLLNLTMRFDAKPDKIGIELKDFGTANSAIWSFPSGSFRSFTQLRRTNMFQICLNPLPQYELSITSSDGTGLASQFAGTFIFGSWELTYNGTVVSSYNGDCNVTSVPHCGGFSSCDFILAGNSTNGTCTAGASPDPATNSTGGTNAPRGPPSSVPATVVPASALPTAAPVTAATQATTAAPATASPGLTPPPATTTPGSSSSPATTPPGSTSSPIATTGAPTPTPL